MMVSTADWPKREHGDLVSSIRLQRHGNALSLIWKLSCGDIVVASSERWRSDFGDEQEADDVEDIFTREREFLSFWSVASSTLPYDRLADWLQPLLEKRRADRESEHSRQEMELAEANQLGLYYADDRRLHLRLLRGSVLSRTCLWSIRFKQRSQTDRFVDWVHHRPGGMEAIAADAEKMGSATLERVLLEEMLRTEQRVKKAGLASGSHRPLEFWRGEE